MSSSIPMSLANGRYELGELIGRGGMAEVRVARDTRLGRTVAIKIMRSDLANDEIFLSRFRREAHAVAQMNNPNIVNIYDSGEETLVSPSGQTEHLPYLVMEYVKGQTLRDIIKANGSLSQRDAEQVMLGVLNALAYSHRMGIIHRDIKPGNIMISDQGVVKVMDFGIARALDDSAATMTQSQGVVGTAQYLSPEQARGESVDMRSDIYSAGCVLYEMLTGKPPFVGDSAVAIAYQHVSEVATPPSVVVPGLPIMWDKICAKAMAKDKQNRYATATAFKNDILAFMNGGVPVAATFNPLMDLANMRSRKEAERGGAGAPGMAGAANANGAPSADAATRTQAFQPYADEQYANANQGAQPDASQYPTAPYGEAYGAQPTTTTGQYNTYGGYGTPGRAEQRAAAARQRRKRAMIIGSLLAALAVVVLCVGAWFLITNNRGETMVDVPTFTAQTTIDRAREQLDALGLHMRVERDAQSAQPEGTFTRQDPQGGSRVARGSTVTLWFSSGPQQVTIPNVANDTQSEARAKLKALGLQIGESTQAEDSDRVPRDHVTRTDPAAGTKSTRGSMVVLFVSSGMTKIPQNLMGMQKDAALKALQDKGFNTVVEEDYSADAPAGTVIQSNPAPGTSVQQHSSVTITISQGKEQVSVPSLPSGITLRQAKKLLENDGFEVATVSPNASDTDIVVSSNPAMGQKVDKGSTVTLTTAPSASSSSADTGTATPPISSGGSGGSGSGSGSGSGGL